MRYFQSPKSFAEFLYEKTAALGVVESAALAKVGAIVQKDAKGRIGVYQEEDGPFPAWSDLAPSTVADRISKGFTPNDPLYRTGDMRDSIEYSNDESRVVIGSASKVALWQEMGTTGPNAGAGGYHVPPRPFLGPALFVNASKCARIIGEEIAVWLAGVRANKW